MLSLTLSEDAGHLGLFGGEDALAREEQLEENRPEERGADETAEDRQTEESTAR